MEALIFYRPVGSSPPLGGRISLGSSSLGGGSLGSLGSVPPAAPFPPPPLPAPGVEVEDEEVGDVGEDWGPAPK